MVWKTKQMKNKLNFLGTKQVKKKMGGNKTKMELFVEKNQKVQSVLFEKNQRWNFLNFWNFLIFLILNFL